MNMIEDISRPDVNGVPPKMLPILPLFSPLAELVPVGHARTDDNLMSTIWVAGSFDKRETWANGIFENSRYFRFMISTEKGRRYYSEGDRVTAELTTDRGFRKYTATPEKVAAKIRAWIETHNNA